MSNNQTVIKPEFVSNTQSTKEIIKALFFPMSPKGRGCIGYLLFLPLTVIKLSVLIAIPGFIISGFSNPGMFWGAIICFIVFMPAIFAIMAFRGKVVHTQLPQDDLKKQITILLQKKGATALNTTRGNILEFEFNREKNPINICAETSTVSGVKGTYVRLFLLGYIDGVKESRYDDDSGYIFVIRLLFGLFVTHGAMKANKIIKQLEQEISSLVANSPQPKSTSVKTQKATKQSWGKLLNDDEIMELLVKYENKFYSEKGKKSISVGITFPLIQGRAGIIDRNERMVQIISEERVEKSIHKHISLVISAEGSFRLMHERTNTEYSQTYDGGLVQLRIIDSDDDDAAGQELRENNVGVVLGLNFVGLPEDENRDDNVFVNIGNEVVQMLNATGILTDSVEVYEYRDGEEIAIY